MRYQKNLSSSPPTRRRIVVRAPNFIGDCVMARDFFASLRSSYPDADCVAIAPPSCQALLQMDAFFDEVWEFSDRSWKGIRAMGKRVKAESFDLAVSVPSSISSAYLFWAAGVKERVGYAEPLAKFFYTRSIPWLGRKSGKHKAQLYRDLLSLLNLPSSASASAWEKEGHEPFPTSLPQTPYFVIAPGASIKLRQWPHTEAFLKKVRERFSDHAILILGSSQESNWNQIAERMADAGVVSLVGQTSIPEVIAICEQAKAVVAMDSGIAHLAATLAGAPTVVVFGPGDPEYIQPIGNVTAVRRTDLACSPCESAHCKAPFGYQACLKELSVDVVVQALEKSRIRNLS